MTPFTVHTGLACPLGLANVDTDQLLPGRFLKMSRSEGLGRVLLADLRFHHGVEVPGFALNHPVWRRASILIARRNFGSGSSREAAVYALEDYGIRVVIAPSFGDIFASNAVKNGLLAACVDDSDVEDMLSALRAKPDMPVTADLVQQQVLWGNRTAALSLEAGWREQLLNGWDDLLVTREHGDAIAAFQRSDEATRPWARPTRPKR